MVLLFNIVDRRVSLMPIYTSLSTLLQTPPESHLIRIHKLAVRLVCMSKVVDHVAILLHQKDENT